MDYKQLVFKDRLNTNCMKWDGLEDTFGESDLLAAWVADMDIEAPSCVRDALKEYVDFNVYGYYKVPDSFYNTFIEWMKERHSYEVEREWLRFAPGVVPAIYWLIQTLTRENDCVAIMPPIYYPFGNAIRDTARTIIDVPLERHGSRYNMDLELFEKKIVQKDIKMFIMSSPHNPVGRVWTREELKAVLDICRKHNVYVIADEIHSDLIMSGHEHVVAATVGNYDSILVTLTSASKTFNLAGCQNAVAIIPNDAIRAKYDGFIRKIHVNSGNNFGYVAYEAAWKHGKEWLDELLCLIESNYKLLVDGLAETLPGVIVAPLEGTYLAWLDLEAYLDYSNVERALVEKCKVAPDFGEWFGSDYVGDYDNFIRINLATKPENIEELVRRLAKLDEN